MEITFDRRFRGPLTSANGGFACGSLAAFVDAGEVEVTLRLPPPLGRPLQVRTDDGSAALLDGDDVVAEARAAPLEVEVPAPVSVAEAEDATTRFVAIGSPLFGECFVCGTREDGDGLGVHAGPVASRAPLLASPWTAREPSRAVVWAAIDCPGAYAVGVAGRGEIVLGRMTARVDRVPEPGERCVAVAWPLGEEGRKLFAGTALFAADGQLLAAARQVWIEPRVSAG
jgi:hypothetical protein